MNTVNLKAKLALFDTHWEPTVVGELNGQHVTPAKFLGTFVWHRHEAEDDLVHVLAGSLTMECRDRSVLISEGEFLIVLRGVEHRPVAVQEAHVLLFEPITTLNTGDVYGPLTVPRPQSL